MSEHVFFYGTLMTPFNRPGRERVNSQMAFVGRGSIRASLYDLGIYPAAVPSTDGSVVWGEVYALRDSAEVLSTLDEIEGYQSGAPDRSLYTRAQIEVTLQDGRITPAWAYFYNAPLGRAQRITSGDYLEHLNVKG
jgi:gamma-glutamylcyclotransferase (GGCT)/AIG2-like uncharacterized protein YtfP